MKNGNYTEWEKSSQDQEFVLCWCNTAECWVIRENEEMEE